MRYVDYDEAMATLSPAAGVDALREELTGGFDPASDQEWQKVALPHGEMHLLPSALDGCVLSSCSRPFRLGFLGQVCTVLGRLSVAGVSGVIS